MVSLFKSDENRDQRDPRKSNTMLQGGRRKGESENPYLAARRTWNDHIGSVVSQRRTWQVIGILSLLIALTCVSGLIYIGSKSKFIPYIVQVDKFAEIMAVGPAQSTSNLDIRIIRTIVVEFINDARLVTLDANIQKKSLLRLYSKISPKDPSAAKMNEWFNGTENSSPFKRAQTELVNIEIRSIIQQSNDTWQIDWIETSRNHEGEVLTKMAMRASVSVYQAETSTEASVDNPMGIYVRDFFWNKIEESNPN